MQGVIPTEQLVAWVRTAEEALEACNRVLHSPWVAQEDANTLTHCVNLRTGNVRPCGVDDVQNVVDDRRAALEEGARLANLQA